MNPSMGQYEQLKSCFRIMIFWKLCPVGGSDLLLEFDYSNRCVSFLRPNSDMKNNQGPLKSTIFKKL